MTAQTLINQIQDIIEEHYKQWERAVKKNFIAVRKEILDNSAALWGAAAVVRGKDVEIGNVVYVSKKEAMKYGRLDKLNKANSQLLKTGLAKDLSQFAKSGIQIYNTEYNGGAWVYNQAYGLPVTSGAKIQLVGQALYSDFAGADFEKFLRKNWAQFADDIDAQILRNLNQGKSYSRMAADIAKLTDRSFARSLRVARTEGGRIQSQAYLDSLSLLDEVGSSYKKEWRHTPQADGREDHIAMNGKQADKDGIFYLPSGATGQAPRLTGSAKEDINCLCDAVTIIDGVHPKEMRVDGKIVPFDQYNERPPSVSKVKENR